MVTPTRLNRFIQRRAVESPGTFLAMAPCNVTTSADGWCCIGGAGV